MLDADRDVRPLLPHEPLPDLVVNGYHLLGHDWDETRRRWEEQRHPSRATAPSERSLSRALSTRSTRGRWGSTHCGNRSGSCTSIRRCSARRRRLAAPLGLVDGAAADGPGTGDDPAARKVTREERAELLRWPVDTVGRPGQPREHVQNVVSVGMLSEGWDRPHGDPHRGLRVLT